VRGGEDDIVHELAKVSPFLPLLTALLRQRPSSPARRVLLIPTRPFPN
jgi:hypothetical protein